jgi:hypothetical protein
VDARERDAEESHASEHEDVQERGAVLVTAEEKENIGYEHPEAVLDPRLQRLAMANREQIYSVVQPAVEEWLGRQVELTRIAAIHPSSAVDVMFRTVDEPLVASSAVVDLEPDGTVRSASDVSTRGGDVIAATVDGLYAMAYRDRVDRMREYLATEYPHFAPLPREYVRARSIADPMLRFTYVDGEPLLGAVIVTMFEAYLDQPGRSDAEWREIFDVVDPSLGLASTVDVMLRDPAVELTQAMARELADDLVANPLFAGTVAWTINVHSNQLMRDDIHFHDRWTFRADTDLRYAPKPRWQVERTIQGEHVSDVAAGDAG